MLKPALTQYYSSFVSRSIISNLKMLNYIMWKVNTKTGACALNAKLSVVFGVPCPVSSIPCKFS
jgi:hypothetical protein